METVKRGLEALFPYFVAAVLAYLLINASGCIENTVNGAGRFITGIGQDIQNASQAE